MLVNTLGMLLACKHQHVMSTRDVDGFNTTINCTYCSLQKFACYEEKIDESEKAGSHQELNPGYL